MATYEVLSRAGVTEVIAADRVSAAAKFNRDNPGECAESVREIVRSPNERVLCNCPDCGRAIFINEVDLKPLGVKTDAPVPVAPAAPVLTVG